jgi:hypothetical protein
MSCWKRTMPRGMRRLRARSRTVRGYVLIVVALLLPALLGLAALVIELGLARWTQRQMQTAVDGAALEGLAGRDGPELPDLPPPEERRRGAAARHIQQVLDDDLNPDNGDPLAVGAGPRWELTGGIPWSHGTYAAQTLTLPEVFVYDPEPALNLANAPEGDLVAGVFDAEADRRSRESADYLRADFAPTLDGDDAFLVRLRRTTEVLDPARGQTGGPIPFLWGQGSLLSPLRRAQGISVRATGIAQGRRALAAGRSYPEQGVSGVTAVAATRPAWETLFLPGVAVTVALGDDGVLRAGATVVGWLWEAQGRGRRVQLADLLVPAAPLPDAAASVAALVASTPAATRDAYLPILLPPDDPDLGGRVIGLGLVQIQPLAGNEFQLVAREQRMAQANASAVLPEPLDEALRALGAEAVNGLLSHHRALMRPLMTPALVR